MRIGMWASAALAVIALSAASANAASDPLKCQRKIIKEAAKFESKRIKAVQKCEDAILKGKITGPCPDAGTDQKITDALAKFDAAVTKACCGDDATCGAGSGDDADLALSVIGWSGTASQCGDGARGPVAGTCSGGTRNGGKCLITSDCTGGGTCNTTPTTPFECTSASQCPGICIGGSLNNLECLADAGCPGGGFCQGELVCSTTDKCPRFENRNVSGETCSATLSNPGDITDCLECMSRGGSEQIIDLIFADLAIAGTDKDALGCQQTLGKGVTKYINKKRKILQKCEDGVLNGKVTGPCPDAASATKITDLTTKTLELLAKKCGGDDDTLGNVDDLTLAQVGGPSFCPGFTVPGGAACGASIQSVDNLVDCLTCMADFKVDCLNSINSDPTSVPAACNPNCGNNNLDGGETCDDGNALSGDACPSDCSISACGQPYGAPSTATVSVSAPTGSNLAGLTVLLEYADSKVSISGAGSDASVGNSVVFIPANNLFSSFNDLNYALRVVTFDADDPAVVIPNGPLFTVTFNACNGAGALTSSDVTCRVEDATNATNEAIGGVACSVSVP